MSARTLTFVLALLPATLLGCRDAEPPRGTGAREAAARFFDAIAREQWQDAFDSLDADSRRRLGLGGFVQRAKSYRGQLGFEPAKVHVRLCEEQSDSANAHVVLSSATESQKTTYRDAVKLRKGENGWEVMLAANFGVR